MHKQQLIRILLSQLLVVIVFLSLTGFTSKLNIWATNPGSVILVNMGISMIIAYFLGKYYIKF